MELISVILLVVFFFVQKRESFMFYLITQHKTAFNALVITNPQYANYNSQTFISLILFLSAMGCSYMAFGWWGVLFPWIVGGFASNAGKGRANEFISTLQ